MTVAHSPVVPSAMNPLAPSAMSLLASRSVSSRSTVLVASSRSAPSLAGVAMMAYIPRRSVGFSIAFSSWLMKVVAGGTHWQQQSSTYRSQAHGHCRPEPPGVCFEPMERSHMRSSQTRPIAGLGWLTLLTTLTMAACGGQVTVQGSAPASVAAASGASVASPASAKPAASAVAQPFSSPAATAPAASQVSLKFVFSPPTAYSAAIFAAFDEGFFKKYGLDVALTPSNSATVVQSVVSGEVPLAFGTATNGTNAIAEGAPFKLVASDGNFSGIVVVSRPEIQSWSDLRGKSMAVSDPFSSSDVVTRLLLAKNGLVYNKDVTILAMGSLAAEAAALESGQVAAAGLTPDIAVRLQSRGHKLLANMAALRIPLSDGGIYANNSYARTHPEVVSGVIRSVWEGTRTVLTNYDAYTRVV